MALDSINDKVSIMEFCQVWSPGMPISPGATFTQGNKQHLIWGYNGIDWNEPPAAPDLDVFVGFIADVGRLM